MHRYAKKAAVLLVACFAAISTPSLADEPLAVTPSGATEAYFDMSLVEASDNLANKCIDFGWTTVSSNETMVVCEIPLSAGQRILSALAAPRYATPPKEFIRFNLAGYNGFSRIQATGWRETQTAFGQTQTTELVTENYHNTVMGFLIFIGGLYPPGTEFPNHAAMEIDYEFVEEPREGMLITQVDPEGPFATAGLMGGDIVTRIARERIKDNNDISDGLHRAVREESFEVEFYRGGYRMEADVPRVYRASAGPLPEPAFVDVPQQPTTTTIVQQEFSVAEELGRLADLRERGILTDEEFDEQKAKLLAR